MHCNFFFKYLNLLKSQKFIYLRFYHIGFFVKLHKLVLDHLRASRIKTMISYLFNVSHKELKKVTTDKKNYLYFLKQQLL